MKKLSIISCVTLIMLMIFITSCAKRDFDRGAITSAAKDNKSTRLFTIQNSKFEITSVNIDKSYYMKPHNPKRKPENDSVLIIKLKIVEGNLDEFRKLSQWIINEKGEKNIKEDMASLTNRNEYTLLFNVPQSSINLWLVIAGTEIDLSKYLLK